MLGEGTELRTHVAPSRAIKPLMHHDLVTARDEAYMRHSEVVDDLLGRVEKAAQTVGTAYEGDRRDLLGKSLRRAGEAAYELGDAFALWATEVEAA